MARKQHTLKISRFENGVLLVEEVIKKTLAEIERIIKKLDYEDFDYKIYDHNDELVRHEVRRKHHHNHHRDHHHGHDHDHYA